MRCLLWDLHPEFEKWLTVIEVWSYRDSLAPKKIQA
jgi:hypothetical protein